MALKSDALVEGPLCRNGHRHKGKAVSIRYASTRQCKKCLAAWSRRWAVDNRDRLRSYARNYHRRNRKMCLEKMAEYRQTEAFARSVRRHRRKVKSDPAAWEAKLANVRRWRRTPRGRAIVSVLNQRRRMLRRGARVPYKAEDLLARFVLFKGACAYCAAPADTYDHYVALTRGGLDTPGNIVPACRRCNLSKGARPAIAWFMGQRFFSRARLSRAQSACSSHEVLHA